MSEFKKERQREITEWMKKDVPDKVEPVISEKKEQVPLNVIEEKEEKEGELENKDIIKEVERLKTGSVKEKTQILEDIKQKIREENWPKRVNYYFRIRALEKLSLMLSMVRFDNEDLLKKKEEVINDIKEEIDYLTPDKREDKFPSRNKTF